MSSTDCDRPSLNALPLIPYINDEGHLPEQFSGKVGIYAIFDHQQMLQCVGYSRDVLASLKQHLVRCLDQCHWVKVATIDRPSRSILEAIQAQWIDENGAVPEGNGDRHTTWTQPIDATAHTTPDERELLANTSDDLERSKALKCIARRVEADIKARLETRGLRDSIRFDPKMKDRGLLNVKP
jgi:hypothetical protein